MMTSRFPALLLLTLAVQCLPAETVWTRFRGPNGAGVSEGGPLPAEFGREKNLVWRSALAPGYSSPVLGEKCVFLTSYDGPKESLSGWTHCIDRASGKELWRKQAFTLQKKFISVNTPVSSTAVTDGRNAACKSFVVLLLK